MDLYVLGNPHEDGLIFKDYPPRVLFVLMSLLMANFY